jgi:hypothetical protein
MYSDIAPLRGTTSLYCYLPASNVLLIKDGYQHIVTTVKNFKDLYYEVDAERAALKEDCIKYVIYDPDKELDDYPEWFLDAIREGWISLDSYNDQTIYLFLEQYGDIAMSPGSVILRNFMGDLRHMERMEFERYYEM